MVIMMLTMITMATTSLKRVNRKEEGGGGAAAVPVLSHIAWLVAAVGFAYFMNQVAPRGVCEMCDVFLIYMWMRTLSHQYTKQSTPSSCPPSLFTFLLLAHFGDTQSKSQNILHISLSATRRRQFMAHDRIN